MPGFGLLLATTAVAVLAFGTVLNRARAGYAWFDALVAPEDDQSVSVDDVLRTVWWVLTVLLVPVSSINWHMLKWLALTGRLILHELLQNIWFAVWLVSLPLRWVSQFMVALQQIFWSTPRSDAAKRLRAEQLAACAKRAANLLGQGGTWPVAAAADSIKGGDTSRPSRRLERANSEGGGELHADRQHDLVEARRWHPSTYRWSASSSTCSTACSRLLRHELWKQGEHEKPAQWVEGAHWTMKEGKA